MKRQTVDFEGINPFKMHVSYMEIDRNSPLNVNDDHIHDACEIYINLSGDVSFSVEGAVYPVTPGSIIITRPYEYHHCIYHSNKMHRHFWILLEPAGNDWLLDKFYGREIGKKNMIMLSEKKREELTEACTVLARGDACPSRRYECFFKIIRLISEGENVSEGEAYRGIVTEAVRYIREHISEPAKINELAKICNVSVNTLERQFKKSLYMSPNEYVKKVRLANAAKLLAEDKSVTEAAEQSGFSDTSGFIALFKESYGVTPFNYKKAHRIKDFTMH